MSARVVRLAARGAVLAVVGIIVVTVAVQYAHIIRRNWEYASRLHAVQADVDALTRKRAEQQREIARLSDPEGAVPEIHDRLHLVRDHEAIIYLKRHDAPSGRE
jgi:cell division protein FtsB